MQRTLLHQRRLRNEWLCDKQGSQSAEAPFYGRGSIEFGTSLTGGADKEDVKARIGSTFIVRARVLLWHGAYNLSAVAGTINLILVENSWWRSGI